MSSSSARSRSMSVAPSKHASNILAAGSAASASSDSNSGRVAASENDKKAAMHDELMNRQSQAFAEIHSLRNQVFRLESLVTSLMKEVSDLRSEVANKAKDTEVLQVENEEAAAVTVDATEEVVANEKGYSVSTLSSPKSTSSQSNGPSASFSAQPKPPVPAPLLPSSSSLSADMDDMESVAAIFDEYRTALSSIFMFYAYCSNQNKAECALDRRGAFRFAKDCGIVSLISSDLTIDLLFTRVLKSRLASASVALAEEISQQEFQMLLLGIAQSAFRDFGDDLLSTKLHSLLRSYVVPNALREDASPVIISPSSDKALSIILRNNQKILLKVFQKYAAEYVTNGHDPRKEKGTTPLSFPGLVEFIKRHDFQSLITKPMLRSIFFTATNTDQVAFANPKFIPECSFDEFLAIITTSACVMYSNPAFAATYNTNAKRLQKVVQRIVDESNLQ
ncbi:putative mitochondrial protein [Andalucia godoyi]|uniref:Putative mitochondrial protein n=1 Tax=Andalucia godoyi TaxID=505711 RepID=A0A8K0AJW6_ANDGO|nr:putative mitochondrial protein [Andalucia godoyi]|eukprot:ANDGO_00004.mRNA.1 putative mitochondrial protein